MHQHFARAGRLLRCHRSRTQTRLTSQRSASWPKTVTTAVAHATEQRTPARVRIALGAAVGRQQSNTLRLPLGDGGGRPVVPVANQGACRLLRKGWQGHQLVHIGGRNAEAGDDARPLQSDVDPQAVEGLTHQRILAKRCLAAPSAGSDRRGRTPQLAWGSCRG